MVDEPGEDIIMSKFVYYNNLNANNGNVRPGRSTDYYNYLTGRWRNGDCIQYGGNGYTVGSGKCANYMFPSDPRDPNGWSEVTANNEPGDRRFIQSAGPFTLKPGAVNKVTIGVVWARASSGGNTGSYDLLLLADDKAQKLFNNGFKLLDGPDAPNLSLVELDKEVLVVLQREDYMRTEAYNEEEIGTQGERIPYKFQGYQLFQLRNSQVTADQLSDPDFAREVWQVDLQDEIQKLVNKEYAADVDAYIPQVMVDGANEGVSHSIQLNTDAFASGNAQMVNHRTYHYLLLAYAATGIENTSENIQYLPGRRIQRFSVTPGKTEMLFDGMKLQSQYGEGPEITRLEGLGNGSIQIELSKATVDTILAQGKDLSPTYQNAHGPVKVKVIDPMKVPVADFYLRFIDSNIFDTERQPLFASVEAQEVAVQDMELKIATRETNLQLYQDTIQQWAKSIALLRDRFYEWKRIAKQDTTSSDDSLKYELLAAKIYEEMEAMQQDSLAMEDDITLEQERMDRQLAKLVSEQNKLEKQEARAQDVIWELTRVNADGTRQVIQAERGLIDNNEMTIDEWGISITAGPEYGPGDLDNDPQNGYLGTTLTYEDGQTEWLGALPRVENTNTSVPFIYDWIRSGNYFDDDGTSDPAFHDVRYNQLRDGHSGILDRNAAFKSDGALIAPYMLTSRTLEYNGFSSYGLCQAPGYGAECSNIFLLPGIDLVFTADRSKWSRVLVVEMGEDTEFTEGGVEKFHVRNHASLELEPDANGNPVYSNTSTGFSWFPGYAINVETGERLNIIVGENSSLKPANCKDMIWNPSDQLTDRNIPVQLDGGAVVGGMHYIYVMGATSNYNITTTDAIAAYDGCETYSRYLRKESGQYSPFVFNDIWGDCMWVMPAMLNDGYDLRSWKDGLIPTHTKLSTRVNRAYQSHKPLDVARNHNLPMFHFNTGSIAPHFGNEVATEALKDMRVVPNPYYAQSDYERTQLDNMVKLTNLPRACTIKIYSVNGVLVKTFTKAETQATHNRELVWDLKNEAEVPVASGAYIIHVEAPGIGQQTLKLMAIMKPVDLDTF